jgi:hypothetical protein
MKNPNALIVFARTPEVARSGGGDPFAALPWEDLDAVFHGCATDVVESALALPETDVIVYRDARFPRTRLTATFGDVVEPVDLPEGPIGDAAQQAMESAFLEFYHRVVVVLDNNPLVGEAAMRAATDQLGVEDDCAVVVPADAGGAVLVALKAGCRRLFPGRAGAAGGPWGGVLARLCEEEMMLFPMRPSFLLDTTANLERLRGALASLDPEDAGFPKRTEAAFRALEKKYRWKKGKG